MGLDNLTDYLRKNLQISFPDKNIVSFDCAKVLAIYTLSISNTL